MKKICLFFSLLIMFSCKASNKTSTSDNSAKPEIVLEQDSLSNVSFISGTRQQVFPGIDDGSGRFTENYILKLDVPRDYAPKISMEFMGYLIPIDRTITYISDEEKAVLMYTITYPLMDNYDEANNPASAIPILYFTAEGSVVRLDISTCKNMSPVAYPTMNKEDH